MSHYMTDEYNSGKKHFERSIKNLENYVETLKEADEDVPVDRSDLDKFRESVEEMLDYWKYYGGEVDNLQDNFEHVTDHIESRESEIEDLKEEISRLRETISDLRDQSQTDENS